MRRSRGFSLIELLITVAIVGILAAIAIPSYGAAVAKSRQAEAKSSLIAIHGLEIAYHGEHNTFGSLLQIGFVTEGNGLYGYAISSSSWIPPASDADVGGSDRNPLNDDPNGFFNPLDDDDDDGENEADDDDGGGGGNPTYPVGNPHYDGNSFEVVAIGVISAAPAPSDLDIWSIDTFKVLENLNSGY